MSCAKSPSTAFETIGSSNTFGRWRTADRTRTTTSARLTSGTRPPRMPRTTGSRPGRSGSSADIWASNAAKARRSRAARTRRGSASSMAPWSGELDDHPLPPHGWHGIRVSLSRRPWGAGIAQKKRAAVSSSPKFQGTSLSNGNRLCHGNEPRNSVRPNSPIIEIIFPTDPHSRNECRRSRQSWHSPKKKTAGGSGRRCRAQCSVGKAAPSPTRPRICIVDGRSDLESGFVIGFIRNRHKTEATAPRPIAARVSDGQGPELQASAATPRIYSRLSYVRWRA